MATFERTINSPGVEIRERDLSYTMQSRGAYTVFMTGFAPQGPTEDPINISSITEFEEVFGKPQTAAERYLYHSAKQVLTNSPGSLIVSRLPYGDGDGGAEMYSALVYPICANNTVLADATEYRILAPFSILLNEQDYQDLKNGNFTWSTQLTSLSGTAPASARPPIAVDGIIIVNENRFISNDLFEGYYVAMADRSDMDPGTGFESVQQLKATSNILPVSSYTDWNVFTFLTGMEAFNTVTHYQSFINVPQSRLDFTLTKSASSFTPRCLSEDLENIPGFDFSSQSFDDSIVLGIFRVRTTRYAQDTETLTYELFQGFHGSFFKDRTMNSILGGAPKSYYLENVVNERNPSFFKIFINPNITSSQDWLNNHGQPQKKIRINQNAKAAFSISTFDRKTVKNKRIGNIPAKLDRVLRIVENADVDIDIVADAGLTSIYTGSRTYTPGASASTPLPYYDDGIATRTINGLYVSDADWSTNINAGVNNDGTIYKIDYDAIGTKWLGFVEQMKGDEKKASILILDAPRHVFVQGNNTVVSKNKEYVFTQHTYWPLKHIFGTYVSSYAAVYANWGRVNDSASDTNCWIPLSGFVAAIIAKSSLTDAPWSAPAGLNRGILNGISQLAINPNQKQRDLLYKISLNPIVYFPSDGIVVWGQKTLFKKPSAFNRINVRLLFLWIEKHAQAVLKYFVFEPNTFTTRERVKSTLRPIFDRAKIGEGLYDYYLLCDERNNPPSVIDNNELRFAAYIKPTRTSEYILGDFVATRTGASFEEIVTQDTLTI